MCSLASFSCSMPNSIALYYYLLKDSSFENAESFHAWYKSPKSHRCVSFSWFKNKDHFKPANFENNFNTIYSLCIQLTSLHWMWTPISKNLELAIFFLSHLSRKKVGNKRALKWAASDFKILLNHTKCKDWSSPRSFLNKPMQLWVVIFNKSLTGCWDYRTCIFRFIVSLDTIFSKPHKHYFYVLSEVLNSPERTLLFCIFYVNFFLFLFYIYTWRTFNWLIEDTVRDFISIQLECRDALFRTLNAYQQESSLMTCWKTTGDFVLIDVLEMKYSEILYTKA